MDSSIAGTIAPILIVDFAFAMLTGITGIHGLIVNAGAGIGSALGITPLFGAAAHAAPLMVDPTAFMPVTGMENLPAAPLDHHFHGDLVHGGAH